MLIAEFGYFQWHIFISGSNFHTARNSLVAVTLLCLTSSQLPACILVNVVNVTHSVHVYTFICYYLFCMRSISHSADLTEKNGLCVFCYD